MSFSEPASTSSKLTVAVIDSAINPEAFDENLLFPSLNFSRLSKFDRAVEEESHGTAIAKTILATCPQVRLLPIQLMDQRGVMRSLAKVDEVFAWLVEHHSEYNVGVVCAAFADRSHQITDEDYESSPLTSHIATLRAAGIPTVAAAGNWYPDFRPYGEQGMAWPAILRDVLSVGAVEEDAEGWRFAKVSQRLHAYLKTGCSTTFFVESGQPGETSGAAARIAGCLAQLKIIYPWATVDNLVEIANRFRQSFLDESGLVWTVTCIDQVIASLPT